MRKMLLLCALLATWGSHQAQVLLQATGEDDTYSRINAALAAGNTAVEPPDCSHTAFGPHIDEVYDSELAAYVFRFHIHVDEDNDRCKNFDRQRNEIKTYDKSPDALKGVKEEEVEYKWKFKLDAGFQASSSFTHLHQLKAVGGSEDAMPLITLTARKGSPDKMELRYAETLNQIDLLEVELSDFKGHWIQASETVVYGEKGTGRYQIELKRIFDNKILLQYESDNIRMWKTDADFLRPKWGIYRSLNQASDLRDEMVWFADFQITELHAKVTSNNSIVRPSALLFPSIIDTHFLLDSSALSQIKRLNIYTANGRLIYQYKPSNSLRVSGLVPGVYFLNAVLKNNENYTQKLIKP